MGGLVVLILLAISGFLRGGSRLDLVASLLGGVGDCYDFMAVNEAPILGTGGWIGAMWVTTESSVDDLDPA